MTDRKTRRAVLAELLLLADPAEFRTCGDGVSLSVDFDSVAGLKSWLRLAGLDGPDTLVGEYENTDREGRPYRSMDAFPVWHGWKIYARAREYIAPPLAPAVADRLAALAVTR